MCRDPDPDVYRHQNGKSDLNWHLALPIHNTGCLPVLWCTRSWWGETMSWGCSPSSGSTGSPTSSKGKASSKQCSASGLGTSKVTRLRNNYFWMGSGSVSTFLAHKPEIFTKIFIWVNLIHTRSLKQKNIIRYRHRYCTTVLQFCSSSSRLRYWSWIIGMTVFEFRIQNKLFLSPHHYFTRVLNVPISRTVPPGA